MTVTALDRRVKIEELGQRLTITFMHIHEDAAVKNKCLISIRSAPERLICGVVSRTRALSRRDFDATRPFCLKYGGGLFFKTADKLHLSLKDENGEMIWSLGAAAVLRSCLFSLQMNQQMSGMSLNGAGAAVGFGQPGTAVGGWAAPPSGQTLSTQLWK